MYHPRHSNKEKSPVQQYVQRFPRGLIQPEGSFRFSMDALLLAAFMQPVAGETSLLDLGTGCGVIALRQLLRCAWVHATGIDIQPELLHAARQNAANLGVENRFVLMERNLEHPFTPGKTADACMEEAFSLVLANPPYRLLGTGRKPAERLREKALFGTVSTVPAFCKAAFFTLSPQGRFGVVFPAEGFTRLQAAMQETGFYLTRTLPVVPRPGEKPGIVLVEARKEHVKERETLPPLVLYQNKTNRELCPQVLDFCPELTCNSGREPMP